MAARSLGETRLSQTQCAKGNAIAGGESWTEAVSRNLPRELSAERPNEHAFDQPRQNQLADAGSAVAGSAGVSPANEREARTEIHVDTNGGVQIVSTESLVRALALMCRRDACAPSSEVFDIFGINL